MKQLYILFSLILLTSSCDDSDNTLCISGEVVAYDACQGVSVIEVDAQFDIGDSLKHFQKPLGNAIQVPGELTGGRGFFLIRNFRSGDEQPNKDLFCLSIYIPYAIPAYTVIDRSDASCL
jgi:hypothetical protein